ncbi:hypothetical protein L7F22_057449 [Adiantum nelumboides]|nr:hypothetical protein [Adiantum nelumboides]
MRAGKLSRVKDDLMYEKVEVMIKAELSLLRGDILKEMYANVETYEKSYVCRYGKRYKKLFNSIDLTKDFFFSYTYQIMWSLQKNVLKGDKEKAPYEDMFVWNAFLTSQFREQVRNVQWLVALVHGYFKQMQVFEDGTTVTLIARRSRHFAGTRYLKRGVNEKGQVANEVETEQIVQEEFEGKLGQISSVVQHRGSIPLFWSQDTSILSPRPDIKLKREDSCYKATKLHFGNLVSRYGYPIIVLNLIKGLVQQLRGRWGGAVAAAGGVVQQRGSVCRSAAAVAGMCQQVSSVARRPGGQCHGVCRSAVGEHGFAVAWRVQTQEKKPRETVLCQEYANAIAYMNQISSEKQKVKFIQWDFHKFAQNGCKTVLEVIGAIATDAVNCVGFYCSSKPSCVQREKRSQETATYKRSGEKSARKTTRLQQGVLRSNCIDCLDRTNVAQFSFGLAALGQQLQALGLHENMKFAPDSTVGLALMRMYEKMGDVLALQYGGSSAHNTVLSNSQGRWKAATQSLDFLRAIKRHYSNAYTDGLKQDAINIFLGHYRPDLRKPLLWHLESDYHLQLRRASCNMAGDGKSILKRAFSTGGIEESQPAILAQTLYFHGEDTGDSVVKHIKEAASSCFQADPGLQEDGSKSNKEKSLLNSRSFPTKKSQRFSVPILIIPETAEGDDFEQPCTNHMERCKKAEEEREELPSRPCKVRMSEEEHHTLAEEWSIKGSLTVEKQLYVQDPLLDYSEIFLSWIQSGHTISL